MDVGETTTRIPLLALPTKHSCTAQLLENFTTVFHVDFLASATTIRVVESEQDKVGRHWRLSTKLGNALTTSRLFYNVMLSFLNF